MPIKGLTDRDSITPRFPRIGKLRKGGVKASANKPGPELDHWRFTSDRPGAETAFEAAYGGAAASVSVYLPYPTVEENFQTWKEAWKTGGLDHRCDGETCVIWLGPDAKYHRDPQPCPGGCKEIGRLEVIIPEMLQAGHIGTVTMETHSLNDLISVMETLTKTAELRGDNPLGLRGILFNLRRVPEQISVPGFGQNAGKRQRVEKWLVKIEPAVDWVQAQMALTRTDVQALTMDDEKPDVEVVEGEWSDEAVGGARPIETHELSEWSDEADAENITELQAEADAGLPGTPATAQTVMTEAPVGLSAKWPLFCKMVKALLAYDSLPHIKATLLKLRGEDYLVFHTSGPDSGNLVDDPTVVWGWLAEYKAQA